MTLIKEIAHRETPLPSGPWVMRQTWLNLLFAHWPIDVEVLRPLIPSSLEIDIFEQQAWVGVVPFEMRDVHPRGLPSVLGLSSFPELNVRTYVKLNGNSGVYFFSLDAGNSIAVSIARSFFHLPYFTAIMQSKHIGDTIYYQSHRIHRHASPAEYEAQYRPTQSIEYAKPKTLARWLTERYNLYTVFRNHVYVGAIHHTQWPLQTAEAEIVLNTMALSQGIHLPNIPPLLHFSQRQEVLIWPLHRVSL